MFIAGLCTVASVQRDESAPMTSRMWKWGIFYGIITLCRGMTNVLSTGYTFAYYCLIVSLLNPFITAMSSRWLLEDQLPKCFCVAAILSFIGSLCVIFGQSMTLSSWSLSPDDWIGVSLAFLSVCFSSSMRLTMKKTSSVGLTKFQLVGFQYAFNSAALLGVTCVHVKQWQAWTQISATSIGVVLFFAIGIIFGANIVQVTSVRELGPTLYTSLQPIRLLPTVLGTYLCLGEPVHSLLSWIGMFTVLCTLVIYSHIQLHDNQTCNDIALPGVIPDRETDREVKIDLDDYDMSPNTIGMENMSVGSNCGDHVSPKRPAFAKTPSILSNWLRGEK